MTVVAHNTAVSSALILASRDPSISNIVEGITGLGPCFNIDVLNSFIPQKDLASIEAIYGYMANVGIKSAFGPNHLE